MQSGQKLASKMTDDELVMQCQKDLPYGVEAFTELVERYSSRVYAKCLAMLGSSADAEDLTQEIFLAVFNRVKSFESRSSFSTWVYAITTNRCLKEIDKRNRQPWFWLTEDYSTALELELDEEDILTTLVRSEESEVRAELLKRTFRLMNELSAEIIRLRFLGELDYKSIAKRLEISLSATKMRLRRAKEEFCRIYREKEIENE